MFNPYASIRKAIHSAQKQLKPYEADCCVLVLYNVDDWEFRDRPYVLFGAMLGDAGLRTPLHPEKGALRECARADFGCGGKMIDPKRREPQNTTISAICVLSEFTVPNPDFEREYQRHAREIDRFAQAIVEHFAPQKIILFGSHAYGTADPDSDVDLLVVFPGDGDLSDRALDIRMKFNPDFALDLLTRSAGEIERRIRLGDCFLKEIIQKGKTLHP